MCRRQHEAQQSSTTRLPRKDRARASDIQSAQAQACNRYRERETDREGRASQTMKPAQRYRAALQLLLLAAAASGLSLSRSLHEVEQRVAEEADLLSPPDLPELPEPQPSRRLESFVRIRQSPGAHVSLSRGQRLELRCEVDGSPPPRVYWLMGEQPARQLQQLERRGLSDAPFTAVARELSRLRIDCAGPQDQGLLHCVGVAGDQVAIGRPTLISLTGSSNHSCADSEGSPPLIARHRPLYFSEMGSTALLPCEAQGRPRPRVHWLDGDGNPLLDPRFAVQPNGDLLIADIRWQDMDGYKCVAESALGRAEAVTFLYPAAKSDSGGGKANAL